MDSEKRLYYPGIRMWTTLFKNSRRVDYSSAGAPNPRSIEIPGSTMRVSSFLRAQTLRPSSSLRHYHVEYPWGILITDLVQHMVEITNDQLYWEAIEHQHNEPGKGETSIYLKYNRILGSRLVARVESSSTPWNQPSAAVVSEDVVQTALPGFDP